MTLSRFSLSTTSYYTMYYERKREYLRAKYHEKKQKTIRNEELYKNFGGETAYYKMKLKQLGVFSQK